MKVETSPPAARGVNQLMYVGDDQAVESAATHIASPAVLVAIGAIALVGWLVFGGRR